MRFIINRNLWVNCKSEKTRYGFRHLATLVYKFEDIETAKACYYNRTWECYQFESVLRAIYSKAKDNRSLSAYHLRLLNKFIKNGGKREQERVKKEFSTIGMVARMGDIFGKTKKEANDWKARMIKAGLEDKGLIMPDNWDELSEDEKETRLNKLIEYIEGKIYDNKK